MQTSPDYYAAARYELGPGALRQAERSLIDLARSWGIGANNGAFHTDLQVLATLQHHGAPTRLLDVTTDPATALWFACAFPASHTEGDSEDAALFAFATVQADERPTMAVPGGTFGELQSPLGWNLDQALEASIRRPVLVQPAFPDARMTAQAGRFLIGEPIPPAAPKSHADAEDPDEDCRPRLIPGMLAAAYVVDDVTPSGPRLQALLDHDLPSEPGPVPFAAVIIPRALVAEVREVVLVQHAKTYRSLFPDAAGLAAAVQHQAVPLPPCTRQHVTTATEGIKEHIRDEDDRAFRSAGML